MRLKTKKTEAACWRGAYQVLKLLSKNPESHITKSIIREAAKRITTNHKARNPVRSIEEAGGIRSLLFLNFVHRPEKGRIEITREGLKAMDTLNEEQIISLILAAHASHAINYYVSIAENKAEVEWLVARLQPDNRKELIKACANL